MNTRQIVTGAVVIFWVGMMGWLVQREWFPQNRGPHSDHASLSKSEVINRLTRDPHIVYRITRDGDQIGETVQDVNIQDDGSIRVMNRLEMSLAPLENVPSYALKVRKKMYFSSSGDLQRLFIKSDLPLFGPFRVKGTVRGDQLEITYPDESGNETKTPKILPKKQFFMHSFEPLLQMKHPEPGESRNIQIIDPFSEEPIECDLKTAPRLETVPFQGQTLRVRKITLTTKDDQTSSFSSTSLVTREGFTIQQTVRHTHLPISMVFQRVTPLPETSNSSESK